MSKTQLQLFINRENKRDKNRCKQINFKPLKIGHQDMLTSEINLKSGLNFPIIPLPLHPDF